MRGGGLILEQDLIYREVRGQIFNQPLVIKKFF